MLPDDVREWLELQRDRSAIPAEDEMLLETFPRGQRHFLVCYPFEGRLAHTTLAMLLTRRLERLGVGPLGFVCNDYALAVWALKPMDGLDFADLFAEDMLGDDLEAWLAESAMMKGAFKGCALIAGLIERRFPGERKTGPPGHLLHRPDLRRAAPPPARPPAAALRPGRRRPGADRRGAPGPAAGADQGAHPPRGPGSPVALLGAGDPGDRQAALARRRRRDDPGRGGRGPDRRGHGVTGAEAGWRYAFDAHPGGALRIRVAGAEVVCRPAGALWLEAVEGPDRRRPALREGLGLRRARPDAAALRHRRDPAAAWRPRSRRWPPILVFLGDSFHDRRAEGRLAAGDIARLAALAAGRTLIWVVGNHDAEGPRGLPGEVVAGLTVAGLTLVHEPAGGPASGEVAGHLHPCARVAVAGGSVRRRCFVTDGERLILPAFGAFAGGLNVRDQAFARLLRRPPLAAVLGARRVHPVGWASLGKRAGAAGSGGGRGS